MSNKERLIANNEKIAEIRETLKKKQVLPTDMLQARVDATNSCAYLFYTYNGDNLDFIKNLDTSNATTMSYMFGSCKILTTIPFEINSKNVTSMSYMFANCEKLRGIPKLNTENVEYMNNMFNYCSKLTSLDLSGFNTLNVTRMDGMFRECNALETLNLSSFNTSKVTSMYAMFQNCSKLTSLDLSNFNTSNVIDMQSMFSSCRVLTGIIGTIDLIKTTITSGIINNCVLLETITLKNIKNSLQLGSGTSYGTLLTNESLINTIKECWDLTGSTSKTLTLSTTSKNNIANIYVKLVDVTDEMLATDPYANNKKPCVVCEPTDEGAMLITEYLISKNWQLA